MRPFLLALILVGATLPASAQTSDAAFWTALSPSMAKVAKTMHSTIRRNLADAAEVMPASDYSFKPDAEVAHVRAAHWPRRGRELSSVLAG